MQTLILGRFKAHVSAIRNFQFFQEPVRGTISALHFIFFTNIWTHLKKRKCDLIFAYQQIPEMWSETIDEIVSIETIVQYFIICLVRYQ